jgi:hypothetical protein
LDDWSPYEMAMAFVCCDDPYADLPISPVPGVSATKSYGHKPRRNKEHDAAIAVPQMFAEPPARPADDAPFDVREAYAVFALATFFPYDRLMSSFPQSSTYWAKLQAWEQLRPRGDKDDFAMRALGNVQNRQEACAFIRSEHNRIRSSNKRAPVVGTCDQTHQVSCRTSLTCFRTSVWAVCLLVSLLAGGLR